MKKLPFLLLAAILLVHEEAAYSQKKLSVAVAANMQFTVRQLSAEFEKETGIHADITLGSSGKLSTQIMEGAPFDLFVSADMKFPEELYEKGFATNKPIAYANGLLVLWTMRTDLKPGNDMKGLLAASVKKIAVANPKTAPYGVAAEEVMRYYKIYDQLRDKLVYGENISQTQQFISSGAADIGFVAKSLVLSDEMEGKGTWMNIDSKAYSSIAQGAVILNHGAEANNAAAQQFYKFLFSAKAKAIFSRNGYIVNNNE